MDIDKNKNLLNNHKDIMKLKKLKRYNEIYYIYGRDTYHNYVPRSYRKKDLNKLMNEKRYLDVYSKYGEAKFNRRIAKIRSNDVYYETGNGARRKKSYIGNIITKRVLPIFLSFMIGTSSALTFGIMGIGSRISKESAVEYSKEIDEYNEKLEKYAEDIKQLELTDMEILMKVTDDMWRDIKGYHDPELEPFGYFRLSMTSDEKMGQCRNMADDVTAKLNAINPEFNARNLVVYAEFKDWENSDIEVNILPTEKIELSEKERKEYERTVSVVGNHMVTVFDLPDKNVTLVIDPTNPALGVVKNGKIHMFSSPNGKAFNFKFYGTAFTGFKGSLDLQEVIQSSFLNSNRDLDDLRKEFGIEAQNAVINNLREKGLVREKTETSINHSESFSVMSDEELEKQAAVAAIMNEYENMKEYEENTKKKSK